MTKETENLGTILAEQIDRAAKTTEFPFDMLKARHETVFHRVLPQINLFDVTTDGCSLGFDFCIEACNVRFRRHLITERRHLITQRLDGAGDKTN